MVAKKPGKFQEKWWWQGHGDFLALAPTSSCFRPWLHSRGNPLPSLYEQMKYLRPWPFYHKGEEPPSLAIMEFELLHHYVKKRNDPFSQWRNLQRRQLLKDQESRGCDQEDRSLRKLQKRSVVSNEEMLLTNANESSLRQAGGIPVYHNNTGLHWAGFDEWLKKQVFRRGNRIISSAQREPNEIGIAAS